jgi:hypothetical protein
MLNMQDRNQTAVNQKMMMTTGRVFHT